MESVPRNRMAHRKQYARRRGAVIAQVAVSLTTLVGFAALAVDVGHMYNVRAELQRSADAASMAAAAALSDWSTGDPREVSATTAQAFTNANLVMNNGVTLEVSQTEEGQYEGDVIFGAASLNDSGGWDIDWDESDTLKLNAVRVNVRRTEGSPSGPVPLFFANIFGFSDTDISAQATAVLTPRDIVFVLDLSGSVNDDSSLVNYKNPGLDEINNKAVYEQMYDEENALAPETDSFGFESSVSVLDNGDGTSTVTVGLTSDSSGGTPALSHVTLGIPETATFGGSTDTSGYSVSAPAVDPTTGLYGVKWDANGDGLGEDGAQETAEFSFTVNTTDLDGMTMTVGTKAGSGSDTSVAYNLSGEVKLGNMNDWGAETTNASWDYVNDPGLVRLKKGYDWDMTTEQVSEALVNLGYDPYTDAQAEVLMEPFDNSESWSEYEKRVRLALGIDYWDDADGDLKVDYGETGELIPYPDGNVNSDTLSKHAGGSWNEYIQYVSGRYYTPGMTRENANQGYYGETNLKYRFGLKTWVDFLQERVNTDPSDGLAGNGTQPMGAIADAAKVLIDYVDTADTQDQVALSSYATVGYGPWDKSDYMSYLTTDLQSVRDRIDKLYPGMWTSTTNIAEGIEDGRTTLFTSPNARDHAAKVMILMTDGIANAKRSGSSLSNYNDALAAATEAATNKDPVYVKPVQIYTVSVGANADTDLMEEIAEIGKGETFQAQGSIEEYEEQLTAIFKDLASKRPVILIE